MLMIKMILKKILSLLMFKMGNSNKIDFEIEIKLLRLELDSKIEQHISAFEIDFIHKVNSLIDGIYSDDEFKLLKATVAECKQTINSCCSSIATIINEVEEKASKSLVEKLAENNIKLSKAVLDIKYQVENESEVDLTQIESAVKKTRSDAAILIAKIKNDIEQIDIKLDAFIDTVSEKIAELKDK